MDDNGWTNINGTGKKLQGRKYSVPTNVSFSGTQLGGEIIRRDVRYDKTHFVAYFWTVVEEPQSKIQTIEELETSLIPKGQIEFFGRNMTISLCAFFEHLSKIPAVSQKTVFYYFIHDKGGVTRMVRAIFTPNNIDDKTDIVEVDSASLSGIDGNTAFVCFEDNCRLVLYA